MLFYGDSPIKGYLVSDALWERILLPIPKHVNNHPRGGGRKRVDDRTVFNAILFVARTGGQWNALHATGICSSSTAHLHFQEWTRAGFFHQLWEQGLLEYDKKKKIVWKWQAMDGAISTAMYWMLFPFFWKWTFLKTKDL